MQYRATSSARVLFGLQFCSSLCSDIYVTLQGVKLQVATSLGQQSINLLLVLTCLNVFFRLKIVSWLFQLELFFLCNEFSLDIFCHSSSVTKRWNEKLYTCYVRLSKTSRPKLEYNLIILNFTSVCCLCYLCYSLSPLNKYRTISSLFVFPLLH